MRTFITSAFRISLAAFVAVGAYLAFTCISIVSVGASTSVTNADVIVVLGAAQYDGTPSALLESRLAHALSMFTAGRAPLIAVTGGKQPADRFTEAAASRRWLTDRGVPANKIISETTGRSTWESLSNLAPILQSRGIRSVIVSSSTWHVQRCVLTLRELGFAATASGAPSQLENTSKIAKETIGVAFGRLTGFQRLFSITG